MNDDAMENDLQSAEIQRLKEELAALAQGREPADFACDCSWTRIRTSLLEETRSSDLHLWRWAAIASCATLVTLLSLAKFGAKDVIPFAESRNPQIWVSGFHSSPAQADVVWATGYDYLPASYPVK